MSSVSYFLEEFDLTGADGEDSALNLPGLASDGVPGLIGLVEFDDSLSAPVIDNGKVRMPRVSSGAGGFSSPVEFGNGITSPISGVLVGMSFATGIGEIFAKNGEVYIPLAEYNSNGYYGTNVAGALVGVQYASGITAPRINKGLMELPEAGGGEVQAAEFVGTITTSVDPGGLTGAEFASGIKEPKAQNGLMKIPLADSDYFGAAVAGGVLGASYASGITSPRVCFGEVQFPLADNVYFGSTVAGGVLGASYASGIDSPRVYFGEVQFPMPGDAMLQGVYDLNDEFHKWADVQHYVGSQIPVAFTNLVVNGNYVLPLLLSIGFDGAGLRFFLSNTNPV